MFGVVQPKPETVDGVSGMLPWRGTSSGILYATHIDNEGFQRFCVSHELGHYLLPGHLDDLRRAADGWHASRAGFVSTDPYELEADYFTLHRIKW
jgi:Zn-dependent peptidase ImmA (M78 family)